MTVTYLPSNLPTGLLPYNDIEQLKQLIQQFNLDATTTNGSKNEWGKQEHIFKKEFFEDVFSYIFTDINLRSGRIKKNNETGKPYCHWTYRITDRSEGKDLLDSITLIAKDTKGTERFRQELVFQL